MAASEMIKGTLVGVSDSDVSVNGCSDQSGVTMSVEAQERGGTARIRGYAEFTGHASTPPKRYTQYSLSGLAFSRFYENTSSCDPDGPVPHYPSLSASLGSIEILSVTPNPNSKLYERRYTAVFQASVTSGPAPPPGTKDNVAAGQASIRNYDLNVRYYDTTKTETVSLYLYASSVTDMTVYKRSDLSSGTYEELAYDQLKVGGWCTGDHDIYKGSSTFDPVLNQTVSNSLRIDEHTINGVTAFDYTFDKTTAVNAPNHNYNSTGAISPPLFAEQTVTGSTATITTATPTCAQRSKSRNITQKLSNEDTEEDAIARVMSNETWSTVDPSLTVHSAWQIRSGTTFDYTEGRYRLTVSGLAAGEEYRGTVYYASRPYHVGDAQELGESQIVTIVGNGDSFVTSEWVELPSERGLEYFISRIEGEVIEKPVTYYADFNQGCGDYKVSFTIHKTPCDGGPTESSVEEVLLSLKDGGKTPLRELRGQVGYTLSVDPQVWAEPVTSCGSCSDNGEDVGTGDGPNMSSVLWSIPLGTDSMGDYYGMLRLFSEQIVPGLDAPENLRFVPGDAPVEVIQLAGESHRQIRTDNITVDILPLVPAGYTVEFYRNESLGTKDVDGYYTFTAAAYLKWELSQTPDTVSITKTFEGQTTPYLYTQVNGTNGSYTMILDRADTQRITKETIVDAIDPEVTHVTTTIARIDGSEIAGKTLESFKTYDNGITLRTREVRDPDGQALTTSWNYIEDTASPAFGRIESQVNQDLTQQVYTYAATTGELTGVQHLTPADSVLRSSHYRRARLDMDGDSTPDLITIENIVSGDSITRRYSVESGEDLVLDGLRLRTIEMQRPISHEADALSGDVGTWSWGWDLPGNQITRERRHASGDFIDQPVWRLNQDGTLETWHYAINFATKVRTVTYEVGAPDPNDTYVIDGQRTTTVTSASGVLLSETTIDIASEITIAEQQVIQTDAAGRPELTLYLDGSSEERVYSCCGLDSFTGRDGLITSYLYDALGRVEYTTRAQGTDAQQVTRQIYDAAGNVIETRIGDTSSTLLTVAEYDYDLSGRQTHQRQRFLDAAPSTARQQVTTIAYDTQGNQATSTTYPNGSQRIELRSPLGQLLQVTGSAVRGTEYSTSLHVDAELGITLRRQTVTPLDSEGLPRADWTRSYHDALGRTVEVQRLASDNSISSTKTRYNSLGQMSERIDPDLQTTLYGYNSRGEHEVTALDLNANNSIDYNGSDRITRSRTVYAQRSDGNDTYNVLRNTTEVWETDSVDLATEILREEKTIGIIGVDVGYTFWATNYGQTTRTDVTIDPLTNTRISESHFPDGSMLRDITVAGLLQIQTRYHSDDSILSRLSYAYDNAAENRLDTVTDLHNGPTTYSYYADGQLKTVTTPDPDSTQSGPGYDPQTTQYTYTDDATTISRTTTLPDQSTRTETFYPTGELKDISGSQTYPVAYTYDHAGRQLSQTTWQDKATAAGETLTAWEYYDNGQLKQKWYAAAIATDGTISGTAGPSYTYTDAGRLSTKTNARGTVASYAYAPGSLDLIGITYDDGLTPAVSYTAYDRQGRPGSITDASGTRSLDYQDGRLLDETYTAGAQDGYAIDRSLDSLNRLQTLEIRNSSLQILNSIAYGYDGASRLETVSHGDHSVTYSYDPAAELRQTRTFNNGSADQLTVNMRYDKLNRLKSRESIVTGVETTSYAYQYNDLNQRERMTLADGSYWQFGYDSLGQVDSAVHKNASDTAFPGRRFGFTFDAIGNRTQTTSNGRVANYTPNHLNAYDQRQVPRALDVRGDASAAATITVNGNAATRLGTYFHHALDLSAGGDVAQETSITVTGTLSDGGDNNAPRVADAQKSEYLPPNPENFTHDADGNLTADGKWHYTWDAQNRLIEMETLAIAYQAGAPRLKLAFAYDSQSRRFSKNVYEWDDTSSSYRLTAEFLFIYDGWNLIYELADLQNGSQPNKAYVWGKDLSGAMQGAGGVGGLLMVTDSESLTYYPAFDGNGNIMGYYAADTGESAAEFEYGPFGELIRATGSKEDDFNFRFSTKYEDAETGLYYYGFRYYDPVTGRWLNRDPIQERGGLNLYGMVGNNPVSLVDILGLGVFVDGINGMPGGNCDAWQAILEEAQNRLIEAARDLTIYTPIYNDITGSSKNSGNTNAANSAGIAALDAIASTTSSTALALTAELLGNTNSAAGVVNNGDITQLQLEIGKKATEGVLTTIAPSVASKVALPLTLLDLAVQDALAIYEEYHELKALGLEKPWKTKYQAAKTAFDKSILDMRIAIGQLETNGCLDECEETKGGTK